MKSLGLGLQKTLVYIIIIIIIIVYCINDVSNNNRPSAIKKIQQQLTSQKLEVAYMEIGNSPLTRYKFTQIVENRQ